MAAIAKQRIGHSFNNTTGSVAWPSTTTAGSLLLLLVAVNGGTNVTVPTPAGWTEYSTDLDQSTNVMVSTFYKANAASTSGSQSINVTLADGVTPSARWTCMFLLEYTGMAISSVVDQVKDATGSSATADTGATTGTTNANEVAVGILAHADAPTVAAFGANSTSYTQLWQSQSTTTGSAALEAVIFEKQLAGAGSTFRLTDTISVSKPWAARAITLNPVSTTPVTPAVPCAQGLFRAGATTLDRLPPVMNGITVYPDWRNLQDGTVQMLTISATGGTFTVSFKGQTTSAIAFNATAATLQTALRALSTIGGTNATVTGSAGGPYTITLSGTPATTPPLFTTNASGLTGGASTATVTPQLSGSDVTMIDNAVTYCTANSIQLKIRFFCNGNNAPGGAASTPPWLTTLCGTFKHANTQTPTTVVTMTRFWEPSPFNSYYDTLQQQCSARWDSNTCLVDVTISNAMMTYAEPLIRDLSIAAGRAELVGGGNGFAGNPIATPGAGYNPDPVNDDQGPHLRAIEAGVNTHARYWPNTCSSFSFNPYQRLSTFSSFSATDDGNNQTTQALITYFRNALGKRGVLENNSVRDSYFTYDANNNATGISSGGAGAYAAMYNSMVAAGPPLFYQTANHSNMTNPIIGDFAKTMSGLVGVLNGNACEPPPNYAAVASAGLPDSPEYTVAQFTTWNAALIANPTGAGTTSVVTKTSSDTGHGTDAGTVTVTTPSVVTKTDSDTGTGTDAGSVTALTTVTNPTKHKPAKRS